MKRELVRADIARRLTFFSAGEESELIRIRWRGDRGYCKIYIYIYCCYFCYLFILPYAKLLSDISIARVTLTNSLVV